MSLANTATRRASSASTTELARQRDLNKYYQLWLDSKSLKAVPADTGPDETRPVRSSHDTTLTALAQLAALRLNAKRGMVSLIDSNTQIILAEATQTVSLIDESRHASGDHIWLGNVSLPRQDCIDEHTFGSITTWKDAQGHDVEIPSFIVNDTLEDDRFKHRPYVTSGTSVRFYAGVPIVTKKGHAIGVYSISDIRPRPGGLTIDEVQFMEDAALVISEHLESVTIFIYAEPPPIELLVRQHLERKETGNAGKEAALLIICTNLFEAAALRAAGIKDLISLGRIIEVISQPVGVRKLGKVLLQRLQRVEASGQNKAQHMASREPSLPIKSSEPHGRVTDLGWKSSSVIYDQMETGHGPSIDALKWKSERPELRTLDANEDQTRLHPTSGSRGQTNSTIIQHYRTPSGNQTTQPPRVLLVDDNAINLKLLVTFMNKIKLPYAEALNGLEAVTKYKEAEQPFDFVLMDLQMPVIDGLEATRRIREFEQERAQELKPSTIIAITGVGNEDTRVEAMKAGMSQFLTKPVKFKTLQQLLLDG
ncbi:hypothetical protein GGR54DRAFT_609253 [Hypoxylon sp. NC1633]|nr:hypothetical protein GGR54DRAFT_609253 [Hypoxylon sp. NC1633]